METARDDSWIFVCDQLNTHKSEALVRLVAAREGRGEDLGVKGVSGILQTLATREPSAALVCSSSTDQASVKVQYTA